MPEAMTGTPRIQKANTFHFALTINRGKRGALLSKGGEAMSELPRTRTGTQRVRHGCASWPVDS